MRKPKHPIQWIQLAGGGCMVLAAVFFVGGMVFDVPVLHLAAKWLLLAAIVSGFLPLILMLALAVNDRLRGYRKKPRK